MLTCAMCNREYHRPPSVAGKYCSLACRDDASRGAEKKGGADYRFWKHVNKRVSDNGCWIFEGLRHEDGYGKVFSGSKYVGAHRYSWMYHKGGIPDGLSVLHKCDNPPCVNPDHLFLGTQLDNILDMRRKGRESHCGRRRKQEV